MDRAARGHLALFAYYYPPLGGAGSLRALSFSRHLTHFGWKVTVITPREGVFGEDPSLADGTSEGVRVVRTGSFEPAVILRTLQGKGKGSSAAAEGAYVEEARLGPVGRTVRKAVRRWLYFPDSARGWAPFAVKAAKAAHRKEPFDAVLSSSPPVSAHVAARDAARALGVPWIADWRDPWTSHMDAKDRRRDRAAGLEEELIGGADSVVTATRGLRDLLKGAERARSVRCVRNGFEPADLRGAGSEVPSGPLRIVHAGTVYGRSQDLAAFFTAFARFRGRTDGGMAKVVFVGKVDEYSRGLVAAHGLEGSVEIAGFQDYAGTVRAVRGAGVLLLLTWAGDSALSRAICPAKMYEYLASSRPILALAGPGSEALEVLAGMPGVVHARFEDAEGIGRALEEAAAMAGRDCSRPEALTAPFRRESQARILSEAIEGVLRARTAS